MTFNADEWISEVMSCKAKNNTVQPLDFLSGWRCFSPWEHCGVCFPFVFALNAKKVSEY